MAEELTDKQRLQLTILSYQDGDTHGIYEDGLTLKQYVEDYKPDELLQMLSSDKIGDKDLAKTVLSIKEEIRDNPNGTMAKLKVTDKDAIPQIAHFVIHAKNPISIVAELVLHRAPDELQEIITTVVEPVIPALNSVINLFSKGISVIKGWWAEKTSETDSQRLRSSVESVTNSFAALYKKYNYSYASYCGIMSAINSVCNLSGDIDNCTSRISAYSGHEWYSGVGAEKLTSCLEAFSDTLIEIGASSRSQINSTYEAVMAVDRDQSAEVKGVADRIKARTAAISLS